MISSTELKKLLDEKRFSEFKKVVEKHFSCADKTYNDVESSRKVVNLVKYIPLTAFNPQFLSKSDNF